MTSHKRRNFKVKIYIYTCVCVCVCIHFIWFLQVKVPTYAAYCKFAVCINEFQAVERDSEGRKESFHCQHMVKNVSF